MQKHLFFVTSKEEALSTLSQLQRLANNHVEITIISSDPLANIYLKKQRVRFKDIGNFYPAPTQVYLGKRKLHTLMKKWTSNTSIERSLLFKNRIPLHLLIRYSLNTYLAEVIHSEMTAEKILRKVKPNVVHISSRWTESPFRRYQSEHLNLENIALYRLSKQHHLQTIALGTSLAKSLTAYLFNFFISSLWQSLRTTYLQLFHATKLSTSGQITILANYYQLENLLPAIVSLQKSGKSIQVIGKISPLQQKDIVRVIPTFIPLGILEATSKQLWNARLVRTVKSIFRYLTMLRHLQKFFISKNQNYWPFLAYKFMYYFISEFPIFMDYLDGATQVFKRKTDLLVTPATADNVSRTIVAAAQSLNIPVLELQHGVLPKHDDDIAFRTNDFFAVWGKGVRETISDTRSPNNIPITGYPHFDHYWYPRPTTFNKQRIINKLKIIPATKVLLILSVFPSGITRMYPTYSPYQFMEAIFRTLLKTKSEWKVIFRPHPSAPSSWVSNLADCSGVDFYYDQQTVALADVIAASDVIIANPSTTVVEAMFQNKPILFCDFPSEGKAYRYSWWPFVESHAVKLFETTSQLETFINTSIHDQHFLKEMFQHQRLFLKNYCSIFSRPATSRVVSLINHLDTKATT